MSSEARRRDEGISGDVRPGTPTTDRSSSISSFRLRFSSRESLRRREISDASCLSKALLATKSSSAFWYSGASPGDSALNVSDNCYEYVICARGQAGAGSCSKAHLFVQDRQTFFRVS